MAEDRPPRGGVSRCALLVLELARDGRCLLLYGDLTWRDVSRLARPGLLWRLRPCRVGRTEKGAGFELCFDPAENVTNQVTASSEANVNNLDPALGTDSFLAAVSSPTTSVATPVWRSHISQVLEAIDTAQPLGEPLGTPPLLLATLEDDAQPGVTPPQQGEDTMPEGPLRARPRSLPSGRIPRAAYLED